jgi:outer membrane murein-binding lipoprotein Lpp
VRKGLTVVLSSVAILAILFGMICFLSGCINRKKKDAGQLTVFGEEASL